MRAFAICYVFLYHYYEFFKTPDWLPTIGRFGWTGVDLFFVLSGFLIGRQLLREVASNGIISIKDFYIQRFLRIMPAYWAVLALYFTIPLVIERGRLPPLWRFLTFTQNFGLNTRIYGAFSHAWSLCVEEHFYLLLPCLMLFFWNRKIGYRAFYWGVLLILIGCVARAISWASVAAGDGNWSELIYYPTYSRLDGLIIGVMVAGIWEFYPQLRAWLERWSYFCLFAGILLLFGTSKLCEGDDTLTSSVFRFPLLATAYGCITIAALSHQSFLSRPSTITKSIAVLSYSIYLSHKMVIHLIQGSADIIHVAAKSSLMFAICVAGSLIAAFALNVVVERPFLYIRNRVYARRTGSGLSQNTQLVG